MEDGSSQGKGLLTVPDNHRDGSIIGKYEAIRIQSGDRFQALIGCQYRANDCDMVFRLQYQIGNGQIRTLGQCVSMKVVLSVDYRSQSLDGERVKFIYHPANGSAHEDYALWINTRMRTKLPAAHTDIHPPATTPQSRQRNQRNPWLPQQLYPTASTPTIRLLPPDKVNRTIKPAGCIPPGGIMNGYRLLPTHI
jgi:hypothetical protein